MGGRVGKKNAEGAKEEHAEDAREDGLKLGWPGRSGEEGTGC